MPTSTATKPRTRAMTMSDEHKSALAQGRKESHAVKRYLEALAATKPSRGRKALPAKERLAAVEAQLADPTVSPIDRLQLRQQKVDLTAVLAAESAVTDMKEVEAEFIK